MTRRETQSLVIGILLGLPLLVGLWLLLPGSLERVTQWLPNTGHGAPAHHGK